jgi:hypothetical protein
MSTSVTCTITTFFDLVTVDLGQELHKSRKIAGGFGSFRLADGDRTEAPQLRSQLIGVDREGLMPAQGGTKS